ncbi:unnamed protein product [Mytilus coruscus]|uniref:B box-type domain-containing protein n=1 Tax=Mytilus coruscus TaxID=42192 RepID=A0A6J8C1Q7_MYTCO|nr:unnamed protein product [Mytilus coruscus]
MTSSVSQLCTLCQDDDMSIAALTWCTDCETFLCSDCNRYHGRIKSTKHHKILSIEDYCQLPEFILQTGNRCLEHDQKYKLYCSFHACACCFQCFTESHPNCKEIKQLSDVLKNVKSSASVSRLESDLSDLKENFENITRSLQERIKVMQNQKASALKEIKRVRKTIDEYLDKIEQKMVNDLSIEHSKVEQNTDEMIIQIRSKLEHVVQLQLDFSKMIKFATEMQTYEGLKEMEKTSTNEAKYIETLNNSGVINDINLVVNFSPDLYAVLQEVKSMGKISITSKKSNLKLKVGQNSQAQLLFQMIKPINEIEAVLKKTFSLPNDTGSLCITSCSIISQGKLVFADQNNESLILCDKNGVFVRKILKFSNYPSDICHIRNNIVVVTLPDAHQIVFVDVEHNKIVHTIKVKSKCYGVYCDGKTISVRLPEEKSVVILSIDGNVKQTLSIPGVNVNRFSGFNQNFCFVNWKENEVLCYNTNSDLIWKCKENISDPSGITIDKNGLIYIACDQSSKIVIFSNDGKSSRPLLSYDDGIRNPWAIDVDRETSTLLVANRDGASIFLYQL